jgi:hypothetical protein
MKLSSVLLSLLLAPAALVHAKAGNDGKKVNEECLCGSALPIRGRLIDSLQSTL